MSCEGPFLLLSKHVLDCPYFPQPLIRGLSVHHIQSAFVEAASPVIKRKPRFD
jgi:hypothetical protein